jgi:hypothetical protein
MNLSFYRNGECNFTEDISKNVYSGQTVTYHAIQFAYYMGFNPIYLVGVDFHYIKPKTIIESGKTWHSTGDDPNHFNKNYFGAGKTFHDPQLDRVKKNYEFANQFLQNKNIKIYDATIGGKLDVFPKIEYQSLFKKNKILKILITGGAGYIGSVLSHLLIKLKHEIIIIDNLSAKNKNSLPQKAKFYKSDFSNIKLLNQIYLKHKFDTVIHLSCIYRCWKIFIIFRRLL